MPLEQGVQCVVHTVQLCRIQSDQGRCHLGDAGANPFGVGRQVSGAKGTAFACTADAFVGLDDDHGGIECGV